MLLQFASGLSESIRSHKCDSVQTWRATICRIIHRSVALTHQSLLKVTHSTEVNDGRGGHRSTPPGPKELQTVWGPQQLVRRSNRDRPKQCNSAIWPSTACIDSVIAQVFSSFSAFSVVQLTSSVLLHRVGDHLESRLVSTKNTPGLLTSS